MDTNQTRGGRKKRETKRVDAMEKKSTAVHLPGGLRIAKARDTWNKKNVTSRGRKWSSCIRAQSRGGKGRCSSKEELEGGK